MIAYLSRMLDHMCWADRLVLEALERADAPNARALELLAHVLGGEHVWLARLEGRQPSVPVWPDLETDGCARLAEENRRAYEAYFARLDPSGLDREVHYTNSAGLEFDSTVEDMLTQVFLHGTYHRGQIALLLRDAGETPAPTDYISFVRGVPAATRWDSAARE